MLEGWKQNIADSARISRENRGASVAAVVSGSNLDRDFWEQRLLSSRGDVFRRDLTTQIVSLVEPARKGNFLGGLAAWQKIIEEVKQSGTCLPNLTFMSMVFGQGKRLSPFTQALGNRKPAFPTPRKCFDGHSYLTMADVANTSSAILVDHLQANGFQGLLIKWGDEAIIPSSVLANNATDYREIDAVRFIWKTEPTPELAREKDWVVFDGQSKIMRYQYARQPEIELNNRFSSWDPAKNHLGVNLGSLAISKQFLDISCQVLQAEINDSQTWLDWDPYVWMALCCRTKEAWLAEIAFEENLGTKGLANLLTRCPDFYEKITLIRQTLEIQLGRPFAVKTIDFVQPFWVDWGLHISMRKTFSALTTSSSEGQALRALFGIDKEPDSQGNIVIGSHIPHSSTIRNSVIIDSEITDAKSHINQGVVIGGKHKLLHLPEGGSALFSQVDELTMNGPHAIAFRSRGRKLHLRSGDRHTTMIIAQREFPLLSNEEIVDYDGDNYQKPILSNQISFAEATELAWRLHAV